MAAILCQGCSEICAGACEVCGAVCRAPGTLCRACGHRLECPNCTAWLVEHRLIGRLQCHHCGYAADLPDACPSCGAEDKLAACGPGVERLAEEIEQAYPDARMMTDRR